MIIDKIKKCIEDFKSKTIKNQMIILLPYLMVIILITRFVELYRLCGGSLNKLIQNLDYIYKTIPRFTFRDLFTGITIGFIIVWFLNGIANYMARMRGWEKNTVLPDGERQKILRHLSIKIRIIILFFLKRKSSL